jgi:glycosyltransferase involved in cell wall biosynthesis
MTAPRSGLDGNEGLVVDAKRRSTKPAVSIVIPMRNEQQYIGACLDSLLRQTYPQDSYEIVVIDGRSSDKSIDIVRQFQGKHANIELLDNPAGIVPTAMNLGIISARGDVIVRADAHSVYPPHYVETCVRTLEETGADNVGGPVVTVSADHTLGARVVAAVLSNRFGVGDSRFRTSKTDGDVDTVPFGAFRRELFSRIGLYREALGRNEDNELNARIRQLGGKVYLTHKLALQYFPARTFGQLLRNSYKSSEWHLYTLFRYRGALGLRHLVPAFFLLILASLFGLSWTSGTARLLLGSILVIYLVASLFFAIRDAKNESPPFVILMPFAFFILHLTYGLATLIGLRFLLKKPVPKPTR